MADDQPDSASPNAYRCRLLLARVLPGSTMARIVDPVIADYQKEYADAEAGRHVWVRLVLILRWTHALARALLTYGLSRLDPLNADTWRPFARGAMTGGGILLALTLPPGVSQAWRAVLRGARPELAAVMPLQLLPSLLAVAVPCAVLLGAITATAALRPGGLRRGKLVAPMDHERELGTPYLVADPRSPVPASPPPPRGPASPTCVIVGA